MCDCHDCVVSWLARYPDRLAWQVDLTKKFVRKSPLLSKFHRFLVRENEQVRRNQYHVMCVLFPCMPQVHKQQHYNTSLRHSLYL